MGLNTKARCRTNVKVMVMATRAFHWKLEKVFQARKGISREITKAFQPNKEPFHMEIEGETTRVQLEHKRYM